MTIKLIHASNEIVKSPSHIKGRIDSDFGQGFYTSTDILMAEKWACRKTPSIINEYIVDISGLQSYTFSANKEWLDFVVSNRQMLDMSNSCYAKYDLLIGPTADDKLFSTIEQYEAGYISADIAAKVLDCMQIGTQIVFKSEKAIEKIQFAHAHEMSPERKRYAQQLVREERLLAEQTTQTILRGAIAPDKRFIPPIEKDNLER